MKKILEMGILIMMACYDTLWCIVVNKTRIGAGQSINKEVK